LIIFFVAEVALLGFMIILPTNLTRLFLVALLIFALFAEVLIALSWTP
jgi:hypothetical protein